MINCTIVVPGTDGTAAVVAAIGATLRVSHSTLVGTGGTTVGVWGITSGSIVLKGNILGGFGTVATQDATIITSLGGNVLDGSDPLVAQPTDKVNAALALDPLGDNGGPTQTVRLKSTSAALDVLAGPCTDAQGTPLTTDQRGFARPVGACDSGAFERQATD